MTDKEIIDVTKCIHFDKSDIPNGCTCYWDGECNHHCYYKKYAYKHQECEELRQYHNKCCIEFENEKQELLERYNQVSRDFYNGKYCNKENCSLLKAKEQECEELRRSITKIFACLIKANRTNKIVDTLWVDNITTLWDYIAQILGIEGDQVQVEEQILQKNQLI